MRPLPLISAPPLSPAQLAGVLAACEAAYPDEGCGVLLQSASDRASLRAVPLANALRTGRPAEARIAYAFDPAEELRVLSDAARRGERLAYIFHSHCDAAATFSAEDRRRAAPFGAPLFPGVAYLVVAVRRGRAAEARFYVWEGADFTERAFSPGAPDRPILLIG